MTPNFLTGSECTDSSLGDVGCWGPQDTNTIKTTSGHTLHSYAINCFAQCYVTTSSVKCVIVTTHPKQSHMHFYQKATAGIEQY